MQYPCLKCGMKHILLAEGFVAEVALGYPEHGWYILGQMSQAENEMAADLPELSGRIREARLVFEDLYIAWLVTEGSKALAFPDFKAFILEISALIVEDAKP